MFFLHYSLHSFSSSAFLGKLKWLNTLLYIIAQYAGAFVASAFVYIIHYGVKNYDNPNRFFFIIGTSTYNCLRFSEAINNYDGGVRSVTGPNATAGIFATYLTPHRSIAGAFLHETLCTMFLTIIVLAICDQKNWRPKNGFLPVAIGLLITVMCLSFSHQEGLAMNPARDLSPRIFTYFAGWGVEVFSVRDYGWFWIPVVGSHVRKILTSSYNKL